MKKRLTLLQMDVHVNDVEYNYNRVQELLTQSLAENPDIIVYDRRQKWGKNKIIAHRLCKRAQREYRRRLCRRGKR